MSSDRRKERLVMGKYESPSGTIYFRGKVTAVSSNQAYYILCCDIRSCFNIQEMIYPDMTVCKTFNSSEYLWRVTAPRELEYYSDKECKQKIPIVRKKRLPAEEQFGEEGEEIVEF